MTVTLQIVGLRQRKRRDSSFANRLWQQAKFFIRYFRSGFYLTDLQLVVLENVHALE